MKPLLLSLVLLAFALPLIAQGAPPQNAADQPYVMEYYYKVQWGHQQEFLQLFLKNHYPLLRKEVESGRMLSVKIETPSNHMTEDARWGYRVTIRFKNSTVATHRQSRRRSAHPPALARPGHLQARGTAAFRNSAGALGPAGVRCDARSRQEIATTLSLPNQPGSKLQRD
jgi:hypothetical protein